MSNDPIYIDPTKRDSGHMQIIGKSAMNNEQEIQESLKLLEEIVKTQQLKIQELELRLEINEKLSHGLQEVVTHLTNALQYLAGDKS